MRTIQAFWTYYRPYRKLLLADLFFAALASGCALAYPLLVHHLTANAFSNQGIQVSLVVGSAAALAFLMAVEYASTFYTDYAGHAMGARIEADMRSRLFGHLQKLSFAYYDNNSTGQLMSRATNDLFYMSELAHHGPEDAVISFVRVAGSFVILAAIDWKLAFMLFAILPFMTWFAFRNSIKVKNALKTNNQHIAEINEQLEDTLAGIRVVQSFANEEVEEAKFARLNARFVTSRKKGYLAEAFFSNGLTAFSAFMNIAVVIAGTLLIGRGQLSPAGLIAFLLYINTLIDPVKRLVNFTLFLQQGVAGFERFLELMDVRPDIADRPDAVALNRVQGKVEFRGVGFRYTGDSNDVFRHLDLTVKPGEYVALVGSSGVGKSTLCSLIPRFYDPCEGTIRIDGIDVRDLRLGSLRRHIGIVQQDVYLFAGTVRENIGYGKPGSTDEEIMAAARGANAHEFIMSLPDGYDSVIGQRGVKLSGGQKQRLSIARVFLKNPSILIFDEATSALDYESERAVQSSFERLAAGRTTFVIAHRLSTIRNANRILVLSDQGIAEEGTHAELLAKNGLYAKLYNADAVSPS